MYPTSDAYKAMVYSREYARQFVPEIIAKLRKKEEVETLYEVDEAAAWSNLDQLFDDVHVSNTFYRTLEGGNFLLDGSAKILPDDLSVTGQVGWISYYASDEDDATFWWSPPTMICRFSEPVTTPGKTIFFDSNCQSFPVDFNVEYYNEADEIIITKEVRGNTNRFFHSYELLVENYIKVVTTFLTMNVPGARVRVIEDVPGMYLQFFAPDVLSMNYTQRVDILSSEVVTGELSLTVRNDDRSLDILNKNGKGSYLQRRQSMSVNMYMVFPDSEQEKVPVGEFFLSTWTTDREALAATFTLRDGLSRLAGQYTRGNYFPAQTTFYSLAEDVFEAAGITNYLIDPLLLNFFTRGILPICTYKEALRLIAQATCSVVTTTVTGGIQIKYVGVYTPWPTEVDTFDYSILIAPPRVETTPYIKSITTDIYTYDQGATVDQLYRGTRVIDGTETFTVEYTGIGVNHSITLSAGTLIDATYYARAAVLTVATVGSTSVEITVSGNTLTANKTQKKVTQEIDEDLVEESEDVVVSNPLVTSSGMANIVTEFVLFWKKRRYDYSVTWRGNPAVDCLDPICIHDDFENNNVAVIVERNFSYQGGVLEGTSKGRY